VAGWAGFSGGMAAELFWWSGQKGAGFTILMFNREQLYFVGGRAVCFLRDSFKITVFFLKKIV